MNSIALATQFAFTILIYCLIGFVIWRFYQMISRMADDLTAIRKSLQGGKSEPEFDLGLPPDHPLSQA